MIVSPASYSVLSGGCTAEKGGSGRVLLDVPGKGWLKPVTALPVAGVTEYLPLESWYIVLR